MEPNDKLLRQSRELQPTEACSLTLPEKLLLSELDLTATNAKVALEPRIGKEFLRVLAEFPPEAIEAAFRGWRDVSPFFPAISDIRELCMLWVRRTAEACEMEEQSRRRREVDAARERGELIEWPDVVKKFAEVCARQPVPGFVKKMPEPPPQEIIITPERREILRQQAEKAKELYGKKA